MMRVSKFWLGALALTMGVSSCSNDEEGLSVNPGEVRFVSSIEGGPSTRLNDAGNAWTGGEKVGVYMVGESDFTTVGGVENKQYDVAQGGAMTATDGTPAKYPTDGLKVRFAAYYPYAATIAGHIFKVDMSNQDDLLYVPLTSAYDQSQTSAVSLEFAHQLSLLILEVKKDGDADATGVTAQVTRSTTADFDLSTGTLGTPAASKALAMTANGATLKALIMPGTDTGSKVVFTLDDNTYTWDLSAINFVAGNSYTYTITLKDKPVVEVNANLTSTVKGWNNQTGSADVEVDENEPETPATTYTATFEGTLTQDASISGVKIKVDYTNATAGSQTITTTVSGAAANGITVPDKQVSLSEGTGSFELDVTGTPIAAGAVVFTLKIDEDEIATVNATVAAKEETGGGDEDVEPVYTTNGVTVAAGALSNNSYTVSKVSINNESYDAYKLGASGKFGQATTTVSASSATKIKFYAVAWNAAETGTPLQITVNGGGTIDGAAEKTLTLTAHSGFVGSGTTFTLSDNIPAVYEFTLANVSTGTTIDFTTISGGDKRALIWGINVE